MRLIMENACLSLSRCGSDLALSLPRAVSNAGAFWSTAEWPSRRWMVRCCPQSLVIVLACLNDVKSSLPKILQLVLSQQELSLNYRNIDRCLRCEQIRCWLQWLWRFNWLWFDPCFNCSIAIVVTGLLAMSGGKIKRNLRRTCWIW